MCENSNTGMGNEMPGKRGIGGMSSKIPGNVAKHSRDCSHTSWGMSLNIPANGAKYSGNIAKHSGGRR